jgi:hypothetical protein
MLVRDVRPCRLVAYHFLRYFRFQVCAGVGLLCGLVAIRHQRAVPPIERWRVPTTVSGLR